LPNSSPREAVKALVGTLQIAVSCATKDVIHVHGGYRPERSPQIVLLNRGRPSRLRGEVDLGLTVVQQFRLVESSVRGAPWKARTAAYWYILQDADEQELLAYHWHPEGHSPVTTPHLHVRADMAPFRFGHRIHLPTGRVALEEIIRIAITEFGVTPLRDDWPDVLDTGQRLFESMRSW
jgi:hypothetical protein